MKKPLIAEIALPLPFYKPFDYIIDKNYPLSKGCRVKIPFGKKEYYGIVLKIKNSAAVPLNKLKSIKEYPDQTSLIPSNILKLCEWASQYYHHPLGEVLALAFPTALRKGKSPEQKKPAQLIQGTGNQSALSLNAEQQHALEHIINNLDQFHCTVLHGITGSGKTEIYLHCVEKMIQHNKQVLIIVPEIGLTPQMIERFSHRFNQPIAMLHSGLTEKERLTHWLAATKQQTLILIGTRSCIFTPLPNLGLIIIDEEHDTSLKQQVGFRYHARDVAIKRAHMQQIPIILGSATPSLETLYNVQYKKFSYLSLTQRTGQAKPLRFHLVDIRKQKLTAGLSTPVFKKIQYHLGKNNQVLVFINRRGYAPVLMCHDCGWIAKCSRCDAKLTFYSKKQHLKCHHCEKIYPAFSACKACSSSNLSLLGQGTERVEEELLTLFPDVNVARIDRDTISKKNALHKTIENINSKNAHLLIGTQMLAKGHHFPDVTLVVILDADSGLYSLDFRMPERIGQLLLQVAGRAGRAEKPGEVLIQTRHPDHPLLLQLLEQGYSAFAKTLLSERSKAHLPPYQHLVLIRAQAHKPHLAQQFLSEIKQAFLSQAQTHIKLLGPIPAPMLKRDGQFRAQLMLKSTDRQALHMLLSSIIDYIERHKTSQKVHWSIDIDPIELY